jgi:EAL domain-containing protein (putative c-di-GMP-specific phosphodiesterase class I)/HPt (histidine-containing phosphotransfer) domain-containing protein
MTANLHNKQFSFAFKDLQESFASGLEVRFGVLATAVSQLLGAADLIERNDALTLICDHAHRLAGAATTFGAPNLGGLANSLEKKCVSISSISGKGSEQDISAVAVLADALIKFDVEQLTFDEGDDTGIFEVAQTLASHDSSIFVLDDESMICELIMAGAIAKGFAVDFVTDPTLFPLIYSPGLDILFLDLAMPGMDGAEIIRFLAEKESTAGLVLMSVHEDSLLHAVRDLAVDHGLAVHAILRKPISSGELSVVFDQLLEIESKTQPNIGDSGLLPQAGSDELPSAADLDAAIVNGELNVAYQPKIDIEQNSIIGYEGLARWRHPEKGAIPPSYFIPLAEEYDLIDRLTDYIMDMVTDDVKNNPAIFENMKISVNISEKLLSDLSLPEKIVSKILNKNLDPKFFTFEITENTINANPKSALDVLTRFRLKGVTLSIDDFGTGHSSLSRLRKIPFNEIKIDKSFIANFDYDIENRIIVENTISLAKKLSLTVVAEGVEKSVHLDLLKTLGCDVGQGFFFGRPMEVGGLENWAKDWCENA